MPAQRLGQQPAGEQAEGTAGNRDEDVGAHRAGPLARIGELGDDDREDHRGLRRGADALQEAGADQEPLGRRDTAEQRGCCEDDQPGEEDALAPEQIAQSAGKQQKGSERDEESVHDPGQVGLAEAEVVLNRGEGDVHDRHVEDDHQLRHADDREGGPTTPLGRVVSAWEWGGGDVHGAPDLWKWPRGPKMEAASEISGGSLRNYTEAPPVCQEKFEHAEMSTPEATAPTLLERPKRADALRNYEKLLTAAREAFAEGGEATSLESIAERAGVGIGTLYRNFPNRQALIEALYVDEVEEVCRTAAELEVADPWEALNSWLERVVSYVATKQALIAELANYLDTDAELFQACRTYLYSAGEPLLLRAQEAGVVRPDVTIGEVIQLVVGIAKVPSADPAQTEHVLRVALDGLRFQS